MTRDMTINDLPEVMRAIHRRENVRWQEGGQVLPEHDLHRLDGVTPAIMLSGVIRARSLGFHDLAPRCRFDRDDRALAGVRMTHRDQPKARPLDGLIMALVASEGLDQTIEGLRSLRAAAAPGDTLASAIEDRDGVVVGDLSALNTLITQAFGQSYSIELANGETGLTRPEPRAEGERPPRPTLGL